MSEGEQVARYLESNLTRAGVAVRQLAALLYVDSRTLVEAARAVKFGSLFEARKLRPPSLAELATAAKQQTPPPWWPKHIVDALANAPSLWAIFEQAISLSGPLGINDSAAIIHAVGFALQTAHCADRHAANERVLKEVIQHARKLTNLKINASPT